MTIFSTFFKALLQSTYLACRKDRIFCTNFRRKTCTFHNYRWCLAVQQEHWMSAKIGSCLLSPLLSHISLGIVPVIAVPNIWNSFKLSNLVYSCGTVPLRLTFLATSRWTRFWRLLSSIGNVPVMELLATRNDPSIVHFPSSDGIDPAKPTACIWRLTVEGGRVSLRHS